jgi:hypothetical protein
MNNLGGVVALYFCLLQGEEPMLEAARMKFGTTRPRRRIGAQE